MSPIHIIGVGLDGANGLSATVQQILQRASLVVGSSRHLSYVSDYPADRLVLGDLGQAIEQIRAYLPGGPIAILTSGDPLFFGLGRLLLQEFSPELLTFHPHLSSVQLAFSRVKLPWQDAQVISAHGRSPEELQRALQQGVEKIAVLTDGVTTPVAIARLLASLDLPVPYRLWVCENLGGEAERIQPFDHLPSLEQQTFAALNVVILQRWRSVDRPLELDQLPLLGIPDSAFLSFEDRPGLMTKREVRVQILAELALQKGQTIWDIGAGTGSVTIEMARLCPQATIYAIEKTAIGHALIQQNCQRFQVSSVVALHGCAPAALEGLPAPDRVFIGGSGANLEAILTCSAAVLKPGGRILLALATLEHLGRVMQWLQQQTTADNPVLWQHRLLQVQLARSVPIANLTRFAPLNPVTLVSLIPGPVSSQVR